MIKLITGRLEAINRREALRYMGYSGGDLESIQAELDGCERLILSAQDLKACYASFDINIDGDNIDLGFARVKSKSLAKNLQDCNKIALFAATCGHGVDREILKYQKLSPSKAVMLQAFGSALAEDWCDEVDGRITAEYGEGKPRFSCGYGDLSITLQRDIFAALQLNKYLGLTLTDDCFMLPTKSVTAIKGIK